MTAEAIGQRARLLDNEIRVRPAKRTPYDSSAAHARVPARGLPARCHDWRLGSARGRCSRSSSWVCHQHTQRSAAAPRSLLSPRA